MDKCRVLIVVDIQADADTLIEMLEGIDFEIKTANGGKEAIELLDSYKPHIVLLDLMMPLVNGWDVIKPILKARIRSSVENHMSK